MRELPTNFFADAAVGARDQSDGCHASVLQLAN